MHLKKLEDTENLSQNISKIIKPGDVIFLYGEIGTGKTTFTRFLINYFERKNRIKNREVLSPTFNIVYDYDVGKEKILHYDLYRLKNYNDISTHSVWIKVNYWFWYSKLYNQFSDIKLKTFYLTCIKTNFIKPFYVRLIRNSVVLLTHLKYKFILDRYS